MQASSKNNGLKRAFLLVGIPAVMAVIGGYLYLAGGQTVETDNAYVKADIVRVSPEVSGVVDQIFVKENQVVEQGQLLFSLDQTPYKMAVAQAEAKVAQVKTTLAELKASYHQKEAIIALANSHLNFTEKEQKRQQDLLTKHYVSASEYDEADQNRDLARLGVVAQQADLERIAQSLGGSVDAPVEQHPDYKAAIAQLDQAKLNLKRTNIYAPLTGIVSEPPKHGQYLATGNAAMTHVSRQHLWLEANLTEKELTYVRQGQAVDIEIDTYPDLHWRGVVDSLSPATSAEFSILPAQNGTGNWVKVAQRVSVRISIEQSADLPELRAGLSAIPHIETGHKRSLFGITL